MARANTPPIDDDADLEFVWANPCESFLHSLHFFDQYGWNVDIFADGNDFSSETIERNRNAYYQQQTVRVSHLLFTCRRTVSPQPGKTNLRFFNGI